MAHRVLSKNDDLPIRVVEPVHSGKVRSVYWLTPEDSRRLIEREGFAIWPDSQLAIMVISDRISAFDAIWRGEGGLDGVPQKGAALNTIAKHWFDAFTAAGLAQNHIVATPHPLVWLVRRARPVRIEAIVRQYITGTMWRAYARGERAFCGFTLPEGLNAHQKLPELLVTPTTKGIIRGVPGVPEADDVNITRADLTANLAAFGFGSAADVDRYEDLLRQGFGVISTALASAGQIFVDTKFEFGYAKDIDGVERLIFIDEVGTPDSSRMWDAAAYAEGNIVENSKEGFRQLLLKHAPDADVLINKDRMGERQALAQSWRLPQDVMLEVSKTYAGMAETITGEALPTIDNPREEILSVLSERWGLVA